MSSASGPGFQPVRGCLTPLLCVSPRMGCRELHGWLPWHPAPSRCLRSHPQGRWQVQPWLQRGQLTCLEGAPQGITAAGPLGQLGCVPFLPLGSHPVVLWLHSSSSMEHLCPRFPGCPCTWGAAEAASQDLGLPGDPLAPARTPLGKNDLYCLSVETIVSGVQSPLVIQ